MSSPQEFGRRQHQGQGLELRPAGGAVEQRFWTQVDAALRFETQLGGQKANWTLGVENLANRRFFKESPYQYSHIYLFPAAPRTVRLSLQTNF